MGTLKEQFYNTMQACKFDNERTVTADIRAQCLMVHFCLKNN